MTYQRAADAVRAVVPEAEIELLPGAGSGARTDAYMDGARAVEDAGYEPQYDIERGVADYIDWLRAHPR